MKFRCRDWIIAQFPTVQTDLAYLFRCNKFLKWHRLKALIESLSSSPSSNTTISMTHKRLHANHVKMCIRLNDINRLCYYLLRYMVTYIHVTLQYSLWYASIFSIQLKAFSNASILWLCFIDCTENNVRMMNKWILGKRRNKTINWLFSHSPIISN